MSTPVKAVNTSEAPKAVSVLPTGSMDALRSELNAKARDIAYNLYRNDGETHGKDLGHWVAAEAKLMGSSTEVRESGPWFHCNCEVEGIEHAVVRLAIDQTQVLVHLSGEGDPSVFPQDGSVPIFYWAKWPQEVDPSTAAAYVKDGKLTIEVKKTDPPAANPKVEAPTSPKS
jgi:Protein of unknown function (DUF2934)